MLKKIFLLSIMYSAFLASYAQLENTAYVVNYGGGSTSGGNLTSLYTIGDPAASDELAVGGDLVVYSGFLPGKYVLLSFGLKKDSAVLAVFYQSTEGQKWINKTGWLTEADLTKWNGVTIKNQRVSGIALPSNNLQNDVPELLKNLEKLETLDLKDNNLKKFPNLSSMPNLKTLALEKNDFSFNDIAPNLKVATFSYSPQDPYGQVSSDTIKAGESFIVNGAIPGATSYQWQFDPFSTKAEDYSNLVGQTTAQTQLSNMDFNKMGAYQTVATSTAVPGLTIKSSKKYVWATTEVFGNVKVDGSPLTSGADVELYRINENGAYDSTRVGRLKADGSYVLGDVVLGRFILKVDPDEDEFNQKRIIQTYYVSQDDWAKADALEVLNKKEGIDINLISIAPPATSGKAKISGYVSSELPEGSIIDDDGRIEARRKVVKAACSMRKFKSTGRAGEELADELEDGIAYYIETDDEGYFNFEGVVDGKYLLNIQFPGVAMDETSGVIFEIGGNKENQKFTADALITEAGIVVTQQEILFNWKPFIKDVVLYPNPTADVLGMDYNVYRKVDDLTVKVTSITGVTLLQQEVEHRMGVHHAAVDMTTLSAGNYFLSFTDKAGTFNHALKVTKK
jgi:hypothetical protein